MISNRFLKRYCCEDISLIENYDKAISDKTQKWECHHRLETDLGLSKQELINIGKYYNVPASELILLTNFEHLSIHKHHLGKHHSEETKQKMSESHKGQVTWNTGKKLSEEHKKKIRMSLKGKTPYTKGRHRVYDKNGKYHYE